MSMQMYAVSLSCMWNYNSLWKALLDRNMKKKDLMRETGLTSATIAKMSKGLPVNMSVLGRICEYLSCDVGDIVSYEPEERI